MSQPAHTAARRLLPTSCSPSVHRPAPGTSCTSNRRRTWACTLPSARDGSSDSRSPGPSLGGSASGLIRLIPRSRPGLRLQARGKGDASAGQLGVARRCPPWRRLGPTLAHRLPASLNRHPALALPTAQQAPASSSTTAPRLDRAPVSGARPVPAGRSRCHPVRGLGCAGDPRAVVAPGAPSLTPTRRAWPHRPAAYLAEARGG